MFTQFTFKNYKSFRESTLPVSPVTIIIGANASGKSNALEGISFLSQLGIMNLSMMINGVRGFSPVVRGGRDQISFLGEDWFELGWSLKWAQSQYDYKIKVGVKPEVELISENLVFSSGDRIETVLQVDDKSCILESIDCSKMFPKNPRDLSFLRLFYFIEMSGQIDFIAKKLNTILSFNPDPSMMKEYVSIKDQELSLGNNASNLSAVIAKLIVDKQVYSILVDMLQDIPEQRIESIGLIKATSKESAIEDVLLVVEERVGKKKMSFTARNLSDGTLRYLAILTALLYEPEGTTLTIEDIDSGIHPERLKKLLSFISQTTRRKNMSVIATTHNPALLNSLSREDIPGVVVCYRDPEEGDSRFIRLVDIPSYPELMATGRLGDLLATGLIEKAVHETEEDREREYEEKLKWIKEEME